jgi:hypothetical protein
MAGAGYDISASASDSKSLSSAIRNDTNISGDFFASPPANSTNKVIYAAVAIVALLVLAFFFNGKKSRR